MVKQTADIEEVMKVYDEPLSGNAEKDVARLTAMLGQSDDIQVGHFLKGRIPFSVVHLEAMNNEEMIADAINSPLLHVQNQPDILPEFLFEKIEGTQSGPYYSFKEIIRSLLHGEVIVFVQGCKFAAGVIGLLVEMRNVDEPANQTVIRGPKEGFVEGINVNTSLLRRRLRNPQLRFRKLSAGRSTQTEIRLCYLEDEADKEVLAEITRRIESVKTEEVYESGMLEELIDDYGTKHRWYSPFPTAQVTERPDTVSSEIQEGKIAVIVDGSPMCLVYPMTFLSYFHSAEDFYQRFDFASFIRFIRFAAFLISLYLPSIYISVTTFHPELVATDLLINLAAQREGIPFPAFVETLLMELIFEILREGGVRMPRTIGPAISIVGAIVLGDSAVRAGLVSPAIVIVVSLTAISSFVAPAYNFSISARILRFVMMAFAATTGLFGVMIFSALLLIHLCSLESMGKPYFSPLAPINLKHHKDGFFRFPLWAKNVPFLKPWIRHDGKKENRGT
ncbi:spore germination protein [Alteribacter natronophilus]|uniref:spore germination protein n=1 Tax=Alteribacter natronophilus TaxID=2583810 RepID=UPI00110E4078|nr:spore germination protein [Alteribacter natronophilus]TMW72965.1 spore germination protein [Alteribacter natronophilus]